jgi:recombination protein RecR
MAYTPSMNRLIQELSKLPGIGEKTAARLAFHILRTDRSFADGLADALKALKEQTRLCQTCHGLTETDPCPICANGERSSEVICVVEEPGDLIAIERSRGFRGRYHVLQGALSPLDGVGPEDLQIGGLLQRLRGDTVREVIVATNPTVEGEATALYLARLIKPLGVRVTRIAHGIPMGGDVEYADVVTLGRALDGRREM